MRVRVRGCVCDVCVCLCVRGCTHKRVCVCFLAITEFGVPLEHHMGNLRTATSDSDWGGCVKTVDYHNRNRAQVRWQQDSDDWPHTGSVRLSSAEISAGGTNQERAILGEHHEDTHIILETDSSAVLDVEGF